MLIDAEFKALPPLERLIFCNSMDIDIEAYSSL